MTERRSVVFPLAICLGLVCGVVAAADRDVGPPDPLKTLKQTFNKLGKQKSYNVACQVVGGISKSKTHQVSQVTVAENYQGTLYGRVLHVPDLMAFMTPQKGAMRNPEKHDLWHHTIALAPGKRLEKLFLFPHAVLAGALDKPKRVEWVWVGDEVEEPQTTAEKRKGSTAVSVVTKARKGTPHVIRVAMPEQVSLTQFVQIQNSGCMSGG